MKKRWKLAAYLAGYMILVIALAATQPMIGDNSPPDEENRYLISQYIYTHGALPTGLEEEVRIPGYGFSYMLYNAFPYIVMGLAMQATGIFTSDPAALLLTARMVNVLAGLAMAYAVYRLGSLLFKKERDQWLFRLAVTFQPMNLYVHSYVNTDSFCMLSTALIVCALVKLYRDGPGVRACLVLAAGVIICALSYYSAYGYILAAMILFILLFVRQKQEGPGRFDGKGFLKYGCLTAGLVLAGIAWWFVRQGTVLQGDFLGLQTRDEMTAVYGIEAVQKVNTFEGQGYSFFGMIREMISRSLPQKMAGTLIAAYGSPMKVRPGVWFYILYLLIWGAGAVSCLAAWIRMRVRKEKRGWKWHAFHICMIFCIMLPLVLFLKYCYTFDYQEQGRYLLPALVPAVMYVAGGISRLPKWVAYGSSAVIVFCAVWQVFAVALPAFA